MERSQGCLLCSNNGGDEMEHVTEALYQSAAIALFLLAVSVMFLAGRGVDAMFQTEYEVMAPGEVLTEEE